MATSLFLGMALGALSAPHHNVPLSMGLIAFGLGLGLFGMLLSARAVVEIRSVFVALGYFEKKFESISITAYFYVKNVMRARPQGLSTGADFGENRRSTPIFVIRLVFDWIHGVLAKVWGYRFLKCAITPYFSGYNPILLAISHLITAHYFAYDPILLGVVDNG